MRLEPLDALWVAFSPRSGETLLLNNEAAAVLEALADGPMTEEAISRSLAGAAELPLAEVADLLQSLWPQLLSGGFAQAIAGVPGGAECSERA